MGQLINRKNQFRRALEEKTESGLAYMAIKSAEIYRERLGILYPPSSVPGEHPHKRNGYLQSSVDFTRAPRSSAFGVLLRAWYITDLIKSGRLGPDEVVITEREVLQTEFKAGAEAIRNFT